MIISPTIAGADLPKLSGRHLVPANQCWYPPFIDHQDVLDVDFDSQEIGEGGLFLVEVINGQRIGWHGCRRFNWNPADGLRIDISGAGEWKSIKSPADIQMRIVGRVERVYKPSD